MTNTTKTATRKFGPLTREEEAAFAGWTLEEKLLGSYSRTYHGFPIGKVGLGSAWYVYTPDGTGYRYSAQFRTAREAAAWIDSDMRLDWVAMWHGKETA